jgi:hypothetical protein
MSDNKKTITLDENNKLVVENAMATVSNDGTNIDISGMYEVSGDDVKKLLSIINDNATALSSYIKRVDVCDMLGVEIITSNEEMYKILTKCYNECREVNNKYVDLFVEHNKLCDKYDKLVEKYNKYRFLI